MGRQINFFMLPDDVAEIEIKIKELNLVIVADRMMDTKPLVLNSLNSEHSFSKLLVLANDLNLINYNFIASKNMYIVNYCSSPVVQFSNSVFKPTEKIIYEGRLYYDKEIKKSDTELINQSEEFLLVANQLFAWIKKHFKNTKINNFLTTERTKKWIETENGKLFSSINKNVTYQLTT